MFQKVGSRVFPLKSSSQASFHSGDTFLLKKKLKAWIIIRLIAYTKTFKLKSDQSALWRAILQTKDWGRFPIEFWWDLQYERSFLHRWYTGVLSQVRWSLDTEANQQASKPSFITQAVHLTYLVRLNWGLASKRVLEADPSQIDFPPSCVSASWYVFMLFLMPLHYYFIRYCDMICL